jgi:hypothetical protein
VSYTY